MLPSGRRGRPASGLKVREELKRAAVGPRRNHPRAGCTVPPLESPYHPLAPPCAGSAGSSICVMRLALYHK